MDLFEKLFVESLCHVYSHSKHTSEDYTKLKFFVDTITSLIALELDSPSEKRFVLQAAYSNIRESEYNNCNFKVCSNTFLKYALK
jgi:hypothetical protein